MAPDTAATIDPAWPITTESDPQRVYCSNPVCGGVDVHPHYHRKPGNAARPCLTLNCPREADVVLIVKYADPARTERPYCTPCADERRRMFPDRIRDEVKL